MLANTPQPGTTQQSGTQRRPASTDTDPTQAKRMRLDPWTIVLEEVCSLDAFYVYYLVDAHHIDYIAQIEKTQFLLRNDLSIATDEQATMLKTNLAPFESSINTLQENLNDELTSAVFEMTQALDGHTKTLHARLAKQDQHITAIHNKLAKQDEHISELVQLVTSLKPALSANSHDIPDTNDIQHPELIESRPDTPDTLPDPPAVPTLSTEKRICADKIYTKIMDELVDQAMRLWRQEMPQAMQKNLSIRETIENASSETFITVVTTLVDSARKDELFHVHRRLYACVVAGQRLRVMQVCGTPSDNLGPHTLRYWRRVSLLYDAYGERILFCASLSENLVGRAHEDVITAVLAKAPRK